MFGPKCSKNRFLPLDTIGKLFSRGRHWTVFQFLKLGAADAHTQVLARQKNDPLLILVTNLRIDYLRQRQLETWQLADWRQPSMQIPVLQASRLIDWKSHGHWRARLMTSSSTRT